VTSHINFLNITIFQEIEFLTTACSNCYGTKQVVSGLLTRPDNNKGKGQEHKEAELQAIILAKLWPKL